MNMLYEGLKRSNSTIVIVPSTAVETMQLGGAPTLATIAAPLGMQMRRGTRRRDRPNKVAGHQTQSAYLCSVVEKRTFASDATVMRKYWSFPGRLDQIGDRLTGPSIRLGARAPPARPADRMGKNTH